MKYQVDVVALVPAVVRVTASWDDVEEQAILHHATVVGGMSVLSDDLQHVFEEINEAVQTMVEADDGR